MYIHFKLILKVLQSPNKQNEKISFENRNITSGIEKQNCHNIAKRKAKEKNSFDLLNSSIGMSSRQSAAVEYVYVYAGTCLLFDNTVFFSY